MGHERRVSYAIESEKIRKLLQDSRQAMACASQFKASCVSILQHMRERGPPDKADMSVGAQLLRVQHPETGSLWDSSAPEHVT